MARVRLLAARPRGCFLVALGVALAPAIPRAEPGEVTFSTDGGSGTIRYHLRHKLHRVDAVSHAVEGRARLSASGRAQVMVRVPVQSFDSGNVNRDAHMKEAVEAARYPAVEVKAISDGIFVPAQFPSTVPTTWQVQLGFHGVTRVLEVPVEITWVSDRRVRATCRFTVSLDAFGVPKPALIFMAVDDALEIDAALEFVR